MRGSDHKTTLTPGRSEAAPPPSPAAGTAEPWAAEHRLQVVAQTEARPTGAADSQGRHWLERRATGLAIAVCNCGWTTGWVPADELPSMPALLGRHGAPDIQGL